MTLNTPRRCLDSSAGLVVRCSLLPFAGGLNATATEFDVAWQDDTWRAGMECSSVEVTVRSVRWPVRRYVGTGQGSMGQPLASCATRGTCEVVDATIWVVPKCMYLPGAQCSYDATGTSCFPYCLATRKSGSMNQQPVFVTAATWRAGKQLMDRDCTSGGSGRSAVGSSFAYGGVASSYSLSYSSSSLLEAGSLFVGSETTTGCTTGLQTVSWVNSSTAGRKGLPFSLLSGQPFAIAGDAILIRSPMGDGGMQVVSERLTGDQQNVFTMRDTTVALVSMPVPVSPGSSLVPADAFRLKNSLVVPPTYSTTRVLATSTSHYVFYATNPDLTIFKAYFDYCMNKATNGDSLPRIQEMLLSSYSPLRVYRACGYAHCANPVAQFTWDGFGDGSLTTGEFALQCNKRFNYTIVGLEYVNDANIAVTVGETSDAFDPDTMRGLDSTYQTWWLHPETMAVQKGLMWADSSPGIGETSACATSGSLPTVGAMFGSLMNAGIFFVGTFLEALVYTPGVLSVWRAGGVCPAESAGHTVLETCTAHYLSLDDFFDSVEDATTVFWGALSYLSNVLYDSGVTYTPVQEVLTGLSVYGSATVDILDVGGVSYLLSVPVVQEARGIYMSLLKQDFAAASVKPITSTSSMARYFWLTLSRIGINTVKVVVGPGSAFTASVGYKLFTEGIYESRADFKNIVIQRGLTGCSGLGEIFGSSHGNPLGQLSADLCSSSVQFMSGMFDMWLVVTVDVDLVTCVCLDAAGQTKDYVAAKCIPAVPSFMQGVVLGSLQGLNNELTCTQMMPRVSSSIHDTLEPWFNSMYISLDTLSNVVDYMLINFDSKAGQCLNLEQDPFIVVIMPQPVDYFQSCGTTDMCHSRCNAEWTRLQTALAAYPPSAVRTPVVFTSTLESSFFPVGGDSVQAPGKIAALSQPSDGLCELVCTAGAEGCVGVAYTLEGVFNINYYCVPLSPTQNVYLSSHETAHWETPCPECNVATQIQFVDSEGSGAIMTIAQAAGNYIELLSRDGSRTVLLNATIRDSNTIEVMSALQMQPVVIQDVVIVTPELLLVNVVARSSDGTTTICTLSVVPGHPELTRVVVPALPSLAGFVWSLYPDPGAPYKSFLLWPKSPRTPRKLSVWHHNHTVSKLSVESLSMASDAMGSGAGMESGVVLAFNGVRNEATNGFVSWVHTGLQYDWLNQLRVTVSGGVQSATVHNSLQTGVTLEQVAYCDGTDCSGCPASIRPMCSMYQSCSVSKCIGTPVNLNRPLCGVGLMLRALGLTQIETLHGAWGIIVQVLVVVLQLQTQRNVREVDLSSQEQAFFGHVCASKDVSAEFFATVVASISMVFQYEQAELKLLQYASHVDTNVHSSPLLGPAALTSFFHHMALGPLYVLSTLYQIFICRLSALLTLGGGAGGPTIVLTTSSGTGAAAGQCLTMYTAGLSSDRGDPFSKEKLVQTAANFMIVAYNAGVLSVLDPIMHALDALLTYLTGVVSSFADLLRTFDMIHCVTPDVTLETTAQCACGDKPVRIAAAREIETDSDSAYWCTGTLSLLAPDQSSRLIWNPYSFSELRALMRSQLGPFLSCSKDATRSCAVPNDPVFATQGVNAMQVFTRCRQNYVNRQWDVGAYAQYDATVLQTRIPASVNAVFKGEDLVGPCLLNAYSTGQNNQACVDDLFRLVGWNTETYWSYEASERLDPSDVDGCIVFSGPADNKVVEVNRSEVFANCLGAGITDQRCDLSGFVWSPSSSNSVPVASLHVVNEPPSSTNYAGAQPISTVDDNLKGTLRLAVENRYNRAFELLRGAFAAVDADKFENVKVGLFSAEGDVIHQLLDCLFMGPFARMDYWPLPSCVPGSDGCLHGPSWARDDGHGITRHIDPSACNSTTTLPFTCGTSTRQRMIKFFVDNYVTPGTGHSTHLLSEVLDWKESIARRFGTYANYQCKCDDFRGGGSSPFCCTDLEGLTANLTTPPDMYISSENMLKNIHTLAAEFYNASMFHLEPWVSGLSEEDQISFNWANLDAPFDIEEAARFDPNQPSMSYTQAEAASPPRSTSDQGLWATCHAALRKVMFSLPVDSTGKLRSPPSNPFIGGDPDTIAVYVNQIVAAAFEDSPLYYHYVARHAPSESRMCAQPATPSEPMGALTFSNVTVGGSLIFDGQSVSSINVLGVDHGGIGAWDASCFCGWVLDSDLQCHVPPDPAAQLGYEMYSLDNQDRAELAQLDPTEWGVGSCPELEISEMFGILDRDSSESWLRGDKTLQSSGRNLLRFGPGGLKAGNAPGLDRTGQAYEGSTTSSPLPDLIRSTITQGGREFDPSASVLHSCDRSGDAAVADLLTTFVDDLFPMAQGITEGPGFSYCLRFAVETAKLKALEFAFAMQSISDAAAYTTTLGRVEGQQVETALWRRRCGSQVQLVSMCSALDIYQPHPAPLMVTLPPPCSLWTVDSSSKAEMYVTPGCLLSVNGTFYDPCECMPDLCTQGSLQRYVFNASLVLPATGGCRLSMDPRSIVRKMEMGWWSTDPKLDGKDAARAEANAWLSTPSNLLYLEALIAAALDPTSTLGNPGLGGHWSTGSGFMNASSMYCDMISDYWPDDASHPVGYHVTVPCMAEDTGYRSFDHAFAMDESGNLVYMEDQTRDLNKVDSHFGEGGLCRASNFGFNMFKTNTMRVCTRVRGNDDYVDIHVPGVASEAPFFDEVCAEDASELPWGDGSVQKEGWYDPLMYNVGTFPFLPGEGAEYYPDPLTLGLRAPYKVGPVHGMLNGEGWGGGCSDFNLSTCTNSTTDCPPGFRCLRGVCMDQRVECVSHEDCSGVGKMCSGVGRCLSPVISVLNALNVSSSFRAHTNKCGAGTSYSMLGASSWGYVPELLQAHGMCSYRDWAAYLNTWKKCVRSDQQGQTAATINMTQCELYMRSLGVDKSTLQNVVKWWDSSSKTGPNMPQLRAVSCDRDYERFQRVYGDPSSEMKGCIPNMQANPPTFRSGSGEQTKSGKRERILRVQNVAERTMALRRMPFVSNPTSGFLNQPNKSASIPTDRCSSLKQCFMADFTWNGNTRMITSSQGGLRTPNRTLSDGSLYNAQDTFMCGVFARFNTATQTCQIDVKVVPLYHFFCVKGVYESMDSRGWCTQSMGPSGQTQVLNLCAMISPDYPPSYSTVHQNAVALAGLLNVLGTVLPSDLLSNVQNVECAMVVYNAIQTLDPGRQTLYFPFEFALYEFPFPWYYQCMMGLHIAPSLAQTNLVFPCASYGRAAKSNITQYEKTSSDFVAYAQTVRGGYRYDSVQTYETQSRSTATSTWQQCAAKVKREKFGTNTVDGSAPFCSHEKHWNCLPSSGHYNKYLSALVQTFMYPTCSTTIQLNAINRYNAEGDHGADFPDLSAVGQSNLEELVDHLVVSQNVSRQAPFASTLLEEISEWGKGRLLRNTAYSKQVSAVPGDYPVDFDTRIPDSNSAEFQLLLALVSSNTNNIPRGDVTYAQVIYGDNPLCGEYAMEPLYTPADTSPTVGSPIMVCPLYSKGQFQCAYDPYVGQDQAKVVYSSTEGDMETYFKGLFDSVHTCYQEAVSASPDPIPSLSPQALPFFEGEPSLGFTPKLGFTFDLGNVASYNAEIDPTTTQSVMCVVGNQQLSFTNCTDANYAALQSHVQDQYTQDGPVIIPPYWQMDWPADADMLFSDSIYAYASTERPRNHQFVWNMMHSDSCVSKATTSRNRVCMTGTNAAVLNPWMAGSWNPFDGCDSYKTLSPTGDHNELIDAACEVGPPWCNAVENDMGTQYCDQSSGQHCFYKYMPKKDDRSTCTLRDGQKTVSPNVDSSMYNLCSHKLEEDPVCQHNQGVLGGGDGFSTSTDSAYVDMYTLQTLNYTAGFGDSLFANPLFSGSCEGYNYGLLQMQKSHLGGHVLGLKIEMQSPNSNTGCLRVAKLPLRDEEGMLTDWTSRDVENWVGKLPEMFKEDNQAYLNTLGDPDLTGTSWDCPLRRRAFYSNSVPGFGPSLPSARRSRRVFGHMTDESFAHPTQARANASERFGSYHTYNGFCFCPVLENPNDESCKWSTDADPNNMEHPCSIRSIAQAIQGVAWKSSHTWVPQPANVDTKCNVQLDWPFVGGNLRDGSTLTTDETNRKVWEAASDVESRRCHVLDRMREFNYTYRSLGPRLARSAFNTIDHGVCHTGRVQKKLPYTDRCVRSAQNGGDSRLLCHETMFAPGAASAQRPASRLNTARTRRQRCSQCSPPPRFKTRGGADMYPESSFGTPYRFSSERVMAADLKEALCGNVTECLDGLNQSAWRRGEFARTLLTDPSRLFKDFPGLALNLTRAQPLLPTPPPDEAPLWETPWMYCPTATSLKTGENCTGAISREEWRASKRRLCPLAMEEGTRGQQNQMVATSVCEISDSLGQLCKAITEVRSLIEAANCLKESNSRGDAKCAIKEHVYTPATWENSNLAFVHETVNNFYKRIDSCPSRDAADCVCPVDYNLTLVSKQNQKLLQTCSAKDASAVALFLNQARGLVVQLTRIVASALNMLLQLALTLQGGEVAATAKTNFYQSWRTLSSLTTNTKSVVSDIGANTILMNGVVGPALRTAITDACGAYNFALEYFQTTFCTVFVLRLPLLATVLDDVFGYVEVAFKTINDFILVCVEAIIPQALVAMVQKGYYAMYSAATIASRSNAVDNERLLLRTADTVGSLADATQSSGSLKVAQTLDEMKQSVQKVESNKNVKNPLNWVNIAKNKIVKSFGYLGTAGLLFDLGMMGYDIAKSIEDAKNYENAKRVATKVWSIVDFSTVRVVLRDLVDYLFGTSSTCSAPPSYMTCPSFNLPSEGTTPDTLLPPSPTQCWADAQIQEIGTTNLWACSASSTCLIDPVSGATSLCAECPLQQSVLYRPFGCNVMEQRCQCNILSTTAGSCTSNRECIDDAFCQVLSDARATSFGVNMCGQCATPGICLVQTAGSVGSCTCMTKQDPYQRCDATSQGSEVVPSPPLLELLSTDGVSDTYVWESSALIPASQVRQAICVAVSTDSGQSPPPNMALASRVFPTTVSPAGRRLLSEVKSEWDFTDYPDFFAAVSPPDHLAPALIDNLLMAQGWNTTAAPCSTVVAAYQHGQDLTPADQAIAHSCAYWRHVGEIIIHKFNLTALEQLHTFLLSPDDFSSAMGHQGVMPALVAQPKALITAAMYSSWLKPVRAAFWLHFHRHFRAIFNQTNWLSDRLGARNAPAKEAIVEETDRVMKAWRVRESTLREYPVQAPHPHPTVTRNVSKAGRRLLDTATQTVATLKSSPYYNLFSVNLPAGLNASAETCPAAKVAVTTGLEIGRVMHTYYTQFQLIHADRGLNKTLWSVLPKLGYSQSVSVGLTDLAQMATYSDFAVRTALSLFGLTTDDMIAFFTVKTPKSDWFTLDYVVRSLMSCDYPSLMYCQNHTRDFFYSLVFGFITYMLLEYVTSLLGMRVLATLYFYSLPVLALWYSYGVSPTCLPMAPPCLADDLLSQWSALFPRNATLPKALLCSPPSTSCLVSCTTLGFTSWQDPVAFAAAALGVSEPLANTTWFNEGLTLLSIGDFTGNLRRKQTMVASPDSAAYATCAVVNAVAVLPALLALIALVSLSGAVLVYVFSLMPPVVTMAWHVMTMDEGGGPTT